MSGLTRRLVLVLLLAVLIYGGFVVVTGYQEIRVTLRSFRYSALALALSLATLNYLLRFLKWEYYLARLQIQGLAKWDSLLVFLSGFVLTITPGKVGEVFKSAVLARTHGVPVARSAPIIVAERLTDVMGIIVLILVGSLGFGGGLMWAGLGTACVLFGLLFILWERPARWAFARLRRSRAKSWAARLETAHESLRLLASPPALILPTLISILAWGAEGLALYVLLRGFGAQASVTTSLFFYATATLAGALIPVPGGLGVTEALIQEQLVRLAHVAQGVATASMLLVRLATLWWAVLIGFVALALIRRRHRVLLDEPVQRF